MSSNPSCFKYHLILTVMPANGPYLKRPSYTGVIADGSRSILKMVQTAARLLVGAAFPYAAR